MQILRKDFIREILLLVSVVLSIALQILFATGFPLNAGRYDNPPYLEMILNASSNLILAPGYGFVLSFFLKGLGAQTPDTFSDIQWLQAVQWSQNIIHFILFLVAVFLVRRLSNTIVASVFVLGSTLYVGFWGGLNSASPEWLQGDLLVLSLLLAANSVRQKTLGRIAAMSSLTGLVFALAFIVKFNSLVVVFGLITIFLFSRLTLRSLAVGLSAGVASGLIFINVFSAFYHAPSTGTSTLNYDTAWILTSSMDYGYIEQDSEDLGIQALRWKALNQELPPGAAFAYPTITTGADQATKDISFATWNEVMALSREDLISFTEARELPPEYSHTTSAIPIYWNIGLAEGEELGRAVFFEYLIQNPQHIYDKVMFGILNDWGVYQDGFLPIQQDPKSLLLASEIPNANNDLVYTFAEGAIAGHQIYWNPSMAIDKFAFDIASTLEQIRPPVWFEYLMTLMAIPAAFLLRRKSFSLLLISALMSQAAFMAASWLLIGMRHKEEVSILPTTALVYALTLYAFVELIKNRNTYLFPRKASTNTQKTV